MINLFTSYATKDNLENLVSHSYLPVIILRNIRSSKLLSPYSDTSIHLRELSPSTELFHKYRDGLIGVEEYHHQYLLELIERKLSFYDIRKRLIFLNNLVSAEGVVLLGYEEDPEKCHRSALARFLKELWKQEIYEWNGN